jgi:nucleotide-binding universal stress UspA family protein
MLPLKKIICPTDFSDPSREAVRVAAELASHFGAEMLLLHVVVPSSVVPPPAMEVPPVTLPITEQELEASARQSLQEMAGSLHAQGLRAGFRVLRGNAAEEIVQATEQEQAELIAIATRGRTGLEHLLFGSVAGKVVRLAKCPVLTVSFRPVREPAQEAAPPAGEEGGKSLEKSEKQKEQEEKIEARLKEWGAKIEELHARAEKAISEWVKGEEAIEKLRGRQEALRQRMQDLKKSGEENWEGLKGKMEAGLEELKEAFEGLLSALKLKGTEAAGKAARKKEGYVQKVESQLKEWGAKIDALKSKADASKGEVKAKYLAQVEELRKRQEAAKKKLQDLKQSGSQAWGDLKTGLDQVLGEMKKSVKQAVSRFKEKKGPE